MPGAELNLTSEGQQNIIINGNPSKTFWKSTFKKYTNFGLQKSRIDYTGSKTLDLNNDTKFNFTIPRYGDLIADTYLNVTLPNIWSPIMPPQLITLSDGSTMYTDWAPYEFRWIDNIGAQMIRKIEIYCGGQKIQEYSGIYLLSQVQRDFQGIKRDLFYEMIGQLPELNDPANANGRANEYPNAYYTTNPAGCQPSISGRILTIPLNTFFGLDSHMAFPLVALQYNLLSIDITFRPLKELFQIRNVNDYVSSFPYVQPNFNQTNMQLYRFLQPPPDVNLTSASYINTSVTWNSDIYLTSTYCLLSNNERTMFAANSHQYLIKTVKEKWFLDITGQQTVELNSLGLVTGWMFYFQRSDVNLRNEWSNYTNWEYKNNMPVNIVAAPTEGTYQVVDPSGNTIYIGPGINQDLTCTGLYINPDYTPANIKQILQVLGIKFDGNYRENLQKYNVYNYIEKYINSNGGSDSEGLLCYNFCLNTSPFNLQPNGAQNMNNFNKIEFEFSTIYPLPNTNAQTLSICNPDTGELVGINKPTWNIYQYNFNLYVMEESINFINIMSGNCGLQYAY